MVLGWRVVVVETHDMCVSDSAAASEEARNAIAAQFRRSEWTIRRSRMVCIQQIEAAAQMLSACLLGGGKVLVAGNGGSAADAQHLAAEFTGRLGVDRRPLPVLSLTTDTSALTAIANDYSFAEVFSRQVLALGRPGDVFVGISTSGRSANIRGALAAAQSLGMETVLLAGQDVDDVPGADLVIRAPSGDTARIQEAHAVFIHALAQFVESRLAPGLPPHSINDGFPFLLPQDQLQRFREWLTLTGQSLATTNGAFDLLHSGHVRSLDEARGLADRLVVIVNDDASVSRLKGPTRPVQVLDTRLRALSTVAAVDHVVTMSGDDPISELRVLRPNVHVKGADYSLSELPEASVVEAGGGRIVLLERGHGLSTTAIVRGGGQ